MTIGQAILKFEKQRLKAIDSLEILQKRSMNIMGPVGPIMQEKYIESKELAEIALWALREVDMLRHTERKLKRMLSLAVDILDAGEKKEREESGGHHEF